MAIGILALQGAFAEHETMLDRLGAAWFEIRQKRDLEKPLDGHIVAARQGNQLVTAFHPELDEDTSVHQYFLDMTK